MSKICVIFGAGKEYPSRLPVFGSPCLVIAADAGIERAESFGATPDTVIGDFDSLGSVPKGERVVRLPREKDLTDMHAAVNIGLDKGCDVFLLYGGTGGRLDHTLANIQLIASLCEGGKKAFLIGSGFFITALSSGGGTELPGRESGYVSVFAHSDVCEGVTIRGLKYELDGAVLKNSFALGVSNEFIGKSAFIGVKKGTLAVYCEGEFGPGDLFGHDAGSTPHEYT